MKKIIVIYSLIALFGYLFGSIPWALIIGKIFYKKDIREYGSHNLGGTNACRVLNIPTGILIMLLDASKCFVYMYIIDILYNDALIFSGLLVCIGHCFPIFAQFKGGKAVACNLGYVLALTVFITHDYLFGVVLPLCIFALVLISTRYMALASISGSLSSTIISSILFNNIYISISLTLVTIIVIIRHRPNIINLINHKESKILSKEKNAI